MSEMLEKIAREIAKSKGINPDMCVSGAGGTPGKMTICYQYAWELELTQARAAVKAMREPNSEMLKAMSAFEDDEIIRKIWHSGIDAILRDEP